MPGFDCEDPPESAYWWAQHPNPFVSTGNVAASPSGGADFLLRESIARFDESGELRSTIVAEADETFTAITVAADGSLLAAGVTSTNLQGEVNGFIGRYAPDDELVQRVEFDTQLHANETPIAIDTSATGVVVVTNIEFDDLMPEATDLSGILRFDANLQLVGTNNFYTAPDDIAIDDEGLAYGVWKGDSSTRVWMFGLDEPQLVGDLPAAARSTIAVGIASIWIASNDADTSGHGEGRVIGIARDDHGSISTITLDTDGPDQTPIDVAALPCGGAVVLTNAFLNGDSTVGLSVISNDEVQSTRYIAQSIPWSPDSHAAGGVAMAANGRGVAFGSLAFNGIPVPLDFWLMGFKGVR